MSSFVRPGAGRATAARLPPGRGVAELVRPTVANRQLHADVHRVLHAVVERGGAVGYAVPPTHDETDRWLDGVLRLVEVGDAALALALVHGRVAATGLWRRGPKPIFAHYADLQKVMAHPAARRRGSRR